MENNSRKKVIQIIIPTPSAYRPQEFTPPITPYSLSSHSGVFGTESAVGIFDESRHHALHTTPPPPSASIDTSPARIQQSQFLIGEGAWSRVYAIHAHGIAVKTPASVSSRQVIEKESRILYYLSVIQPEASIARFCGFDLASSSLFMELVPFGTLESFVESKGRELAAEAGCLANLRRPVVGMGQWLFLAERLATVFTQLKGVGVVHGDVKWSNILLREFIPTNREEDKAWASCSTKLYEPVMVDFSSSHFVLDDGELPEAVNAVTTSFCAPELLESFISRPSTSQSQVTPPATPTGSKNLTPHPLPTFESDLYSMSLCLLAAAIGSEVYGNAGKFVGIYVRQGNPIGWVRSDERGLRIGRGCVVLDVLKDCFGKSAEGRTEVETVGQKVTSWKDEWLARGQNDPRWGC